MTSHDNKFCLFKHDRFFSGRILFLVQCELEVGGWINNVIKTFRVFKATSDPFTVIVMEDLELTGYQMKECNAGLSQQDCENVLEKLAKFHAASVVYYEQV